MLSEIEGVVNQRPLTYVDESLDVLRPVDFIRPQASLVLNVPTQESNDAEYFPEAPNNRELLLQQWSKTQQHLEEFWKLWQHDYLNMLRERTQRFHKRPHAETRRSPVIGEVVLLKEGTLPRGEWKLARVLKLNLSQDNEVRTAQVKISSGRKLTRPISLLYPLEVTDQLEDGTEKDESSKGVSGEENSPTSVRMVTRSQTKANQVREQASTTLISKAIPFLLALMTIILPTRGNTFHVQICPYRHTGIFIELPRIQECKNVANKKYQTQNVTVYFRQMVQINATYCSKIERTVCTKSFFHWSLEVISDETTMKSIPIYECRIMAVNHALEDIKLEMAGPHKWMSSTPTAYSYPLGKAMYYNYKLYA